MSDQLRDRLRQEMSVEARPSLDGLVRRAAVQGAGVRRRRRMVSGAGTTLVVAAVAAVVALGGVTAPGSAGSRSQSAGSASTSAALSAAVSAVAPVAKAPATAAPAPVVTTQAAAPSGAAAPAAAKEDRTLSARRKALLAQLQAANQAGSSALVTQLKDRLQVLDEKAPGPVKPAAALPPGVPATPTGMLELLTKLLPAGSTSHPAVADDGSTAAEIYVSTPTGPGMVRVFLDHGSQVPEGCGDRSGCTVEANGDIVVVGALSDNCIESHSVDVTHPDGSHVGVLLSTCLQWDGTTNAPSPLAMTVDQAKALASDPRWDASMDPALVTAGAADFPTPIQFS
jgi:hypothetical protein